MHIFSSVNQSTDIFNKCVVLETTLFENPIYKADKKNVTNSGLIYCAILKMTFFKGDVCLRAGKVKWAPIFFFWLNPLNSLILWD